MSVRLPNGTTFAIAASYGPAKAFTAATNAKPAKLSSVAHGFAKGAVLEVSSGWARLDGRVARADAVTVDALMLNMRVRLLLCIGSPRPRGTA